MAVRYPFSPDILDAMPETLAELYRGLELRLIEEICSRLKIADQLNEVTVQDIRALRSHGVDLEDIKKAIMETAEVSEKKLDELFDDVIARNQKYYTDIIDLARITKPQTLVDAATIDAIRRQTHGEFRNITRSMAFIVNKGQVVLPLSNPAKVWQWALDNAAMQVQSGAFSYQQAIRNAVSELAGNGIKSVSYDGGRREQMDVAVRRSVMAGINQINQQYREQSMEYLETDLVEVTAHLGARNIDGPKGWENHAAWQGKVYRWKAKSKFHSSDSTKKIH